jgi:hypothetical protein
MLASLLLLLVPLVRWINCEEHSSIAKQQLRTSLTLRKRRRWNTLPCFRAAPEEVLSMCPANENSMKKSQNILVCLSKMVLTIFAQRYSKA